MAMASSLQLLLPIRTNQYSGIYRESSSEHEIIGFFNISPKIYTSRRHVVKTKAAPSDQSPKRQSVICGDCEGNGAVLCSQCKGDGVNKVDFFNGQFKTGASCWLCGGRKEMLCGNCNGAGFLGGFLSTQDQ